MHVAAERSEVEFFLGTPKGPPGIAPEGPVWRRAALLVPVRDNARCREGFLIYALNGAVVGHGVERVGRELLAHPCVNGHVGESGAAASLGNAVRLPDAAVADDRVST